MTSYRNFISTCKNNILEKENARLELEQLLGVSQVMGTLKKILADIPVQDKAVVKQLFTQLVPLEKLSFIGEPVRGLQVMGILESRALDFKNIIMLSVNEGLLPAGKNNASYIPYDMRRRFGLPTYREKDSIYAYHFYRLLHRVENAHFIYDNAQQALGSSEKSRFLTQLETSMDTDHHITTHNHSIQSNPVTQELLTIPKTELYFERLRAVASSGFSPSALTSYVRNPLDFSTSKILKIHDVDAVEEDMALNTMGTIIHDSLEQLYTPLIDRVLLKEDLKQLIPKIDNQLTIAYKNACQIDQEPSGRNKIIYEVSRHYLKKMVEMDIKLINDGNELIIIALEKRLHGDIEIPALGNIKLKGTVDRVDRLNGEIRIIDYKTGKVEQKQVGLAADEYDLLITDYEKSKAFQVLMYAYLYRNESAQDPAHWAGIISFKNLQAGFIPFSTKDKRKYEPTRMTAEVLADFEIQLIRLIQELFDEKIPITEKAV